MRRTRVLADAGGPVTYLPDLNMMSKQHILKTVADFYLNSGDFNGLPVRNLQYPLEQLIPAIAQLVRDNKITLNFGDIHPNPHIKAFDPEPVHQQLEKVERLGIQGACLYPSESHLSKVADRSQYQSRPFTLKLVLGEPKVRFYPFDLRVLEFYRNDPRYHYETDDISGSIGVRDKYFESHEMRESDQVLLQTFGFAYNKDMDRAVAVFLGYLARLSPEHQQIWKAQMLQGNYKLHPDYYRSSIIGDWPEGVSIFQAFLEELHHINEMAKRMGRPPLFKKEFQDAQRPKQFGFLIRPTQKEFDEFVHLLDKMISENIDRAFFQNEVILDPSERPGSLRILDEWLDQTVRLPDPQPKDEMIETFKEIRGLRQRPAHAVNEDAFDQKYVKEQRELMKRAYGALRTLRLILANHPKVKGYQVPEWLQSGTIWTY